MFDDVRKAGRRVSVGADKNYDTRGFVGACRELNATPHVAQNTRRIGGSAIDGRTTRHPGYEISQIKRKIVEQPFAWGKVIGPIRVPSAYRYLRPKDTEIQCKTYAGYERNRTLGSQQQGRRARGLLRSVVVQRSNMTVRRLSPLLAFAVDVAPRQGGPRGRTHRVP